MASKVDLLIHTTASDGADTPRALAEKIAAAGLELFSVTDHDTVAGALEMEHIVPQGVRYIRGVEFSCVSPAGKCHILGYGYDPDHPAFRGALEEGRRLRLEKLDRRREQLRRDHGIELTDELTAVVQFPVGDQGVQGQVDLATAHMAVLGRLGQGLYGKILRPLAGIKAAAAKVDRVRAILDRSPQGLHGPGRSK